MNSVDMTLQTFDTDLFGFSVYRANLEKYSDISALDNSIPKDAGLVAIRVPREWENAMRHTQFRKIENLIYFERSFEGNEEMDVKDHAAPKGTTIEIADLFEMITLSLLKDVNRLQFILALIVLRIIIQ